MRILSALKKLLFIAIVFWNLFFNSSISFALEQACVNQILEHMLLTSPNIKQDLAVVDVGSSGVKIYIKKGSTGEIISDYYRIDLGKSLGRTGEIDEQAFATLKLAFQKVKNELELHQIHPSRVKTVATAGIRDAKNSEEIIRRLVKEDIHLRVLSEEEEAKYVYQSTIRQQKLPPKGAVVIEVGGGSTEIVKGQTLMNIDTEKSMVIRAGSGSLGINDPFNLIDVKKAQLKTRNLIDAKKIKLEPIEQGLDGYISPNFPMRALRDIHLDRTGLDIFETGLPFQTLDFYLSEKGLNTLKLAAQNPIYKDSVEGILAIPSKLIIMNEVKLHYHLSTLKFGAKGGMKEAIAAETEMEQVSKKIDRTSGSLVKAWDHSLDKIVEDINDVFDPAEFGHLEFRVKNNASVASKLTSKWINHSLGIEEIGKQRRAQRLIGDGVGGRLTMKNASEAETKKAFHQLLKSIREKKLNVSEIHNYRAINGVPYFTDEQVIQLSQALKTATGKTPIIKIGARAEKKSGYTALHLNLFDANHVPFEFQIRGKAVSRLSNFEHDLYDIRQGKAVSHFIDPDLLKSMRALTAEQNNALLIYIHDCYVFARKEELHHVLGEIPMLPSILSAYPNLSLNLMLH